MTRKLKSVLLIDDDNATNFIHNHFIKKAEVTKSVVTMISGEDALEYLTTKENDKYPQPELIFLDINMPRMNGWEFLEAYEQFEACDKNAIVIVMLTTSVNPDDKKKAMSNELITDFKNKPLNVEVLQEIIETYF